MPMPLELTPRSETPGRASVAGISEWACYYAGHPHDADPDPERVIEDTVDAQVAIAVRIRESGAANDE